MTTARYRRPRPPAAPGRSARHGYGGWWARVGPMAVLAALVPAALVLAACGSAGTPTTRVDGGSRVAPTTGPPHATTTTTSPPLPGDAPPGARAPLPAPSPLVPFSGPATASVQWRPAGRPVGGVPAVYETDLVPPGGTQPAGVAWMDTHLLSARLYSGSLSPGGGPYPYTAPIQPPQATSLVAAFNGGFQMKTAGGGYLTTGHVVDPLVNGAASLVIYQDGTVAVGAWGAGVAMTPRVVSVRQNLVPLVAGGQPTAAAASPNWQQWGNTCGATSCAPTVPGVEHQWRSGVGVTADGALVYATGPGLDPLQLAQVLVRAGVVEGMQMDINPDWTILATYDPATPSGPANGTNGTGLVTGTVQGPAIFFQSWWARDFITMSARPPAAP